MKTSKADFEIFKRECKRMIILLGLTHWKTWFLHEKLEKNIAAQVLYSTSKKTVTFRLSITHEKDWHGPIENARHEVFHLLLADLVQMAEYGEAIRIVNEADEACVHRLVHAFAQLEGINL